MVLSVFAGCGKEAGKTKLGDKKFNSFALGYAKVDITPSMEYTLPLVGNGDHATRVATGVLEKLWATCVAMTDTEGNTVILFGIDAHSTSIELLTADMAVAGEMAKLSRFKVTFDRFNLVAGVQ